MRKLSLLTLVIIFLLTINACSGGSSGSTMGSSQSCQSKGGLTTCTGKINKLSGVISHDAETSNFLVDEVVQVEANFAVESGRLQIALEDPDGSLSVVEATPGTPAYLSGLATVESSFDENAVSLKLQALDGDVQGINFEILITLP
jgi:hypothetical protein